MHLLVIRFSAMGDVALLAPVLRSVLARYPDLKITLLTRQRFGIFFDDMPGLEVMGVDLKEYKGIGGLYRLYRSLLSPLKIDKVIDQHQNLRTTILKVFFKLSGKAVFTLDKDRKSKKALTRPKDKVRGTLPHTTQRYMKTFELAGFDAPMIQGPYLSVRTEAMQAALQFLATHGLSTKCGLWIGIAPFAQHDNKIWGIEKVDQLIDILPSDTKVFLLGGGDKEIEALSVLKAKHPSKTILIAGKMKLDAELALMSLLDKVLCMDSSNMHFASLLGVDTWSIWGATHPDAGFYALGQPISNAIQIPTSDLACRPCSVFGNKPCLRGDKACMQMISPQSVLGKIGLEKKS